VSDLIDTTEMYLRTVYELEEEGIPPLRARIAERLSQSGPTVSQTVQRMERDGLLHVADDRRIELTPAGRARATSVMRKHRLAEVLLTRVIGLPWALAHEEACRWEHVISDTVADRLTEILDRPGTSPFGNPIPVADAVGAPRLLAADGSSPLTRIALEAGPTRVVVAAITEVAQADPGLLAALADAGVEPGAVVLVERDAAGVRLGADGREPALLGGDAALHLFVRPA